MAWGDGERGPPSRLVVLITDIFDARIPACATIFAFVVLFVCDALATEWLVGMDRACVLVVLDRCLVNIG